MCLTQSASEFDGIQYAYICTNIEKDMGLNWQWFFLLPLEMLCVYPHETATTGVCTCDS